VKNYAVPAPLVTIVRGKESKAVPKIELDSYLRDGWKVVTSPPPMPIKSAGEF
jgi:hypothetical protein